MTSCVSKSEFEESIDGSAQSMLDASLPWDDIAQLSMFATLRMRTTRWLQKAAEVEERPPSRMDVVTRLTREARYRVEPRAPEDSNQIQCQVSIAHKCPRLYTLKWYWRADESDRTRKLQYRCYLSTVREHPLGPPPWSHPSGCSACPEPAE